ncbi:hypothetical protein nbrc107696_32230 [Gordonia spumicola]|uniref:Lycopene cyclase n=1 Tax=Gordonia spumicola TaxID=589161 RepID=A0A7I9VBW5_9ACTN|nr:lycopene cyclase family protein [Gordonia spumicola]GEE02777.1 hypothetical protein nbrc107696_32230 [Gordonia spumicola]
MTADGFDLAVVGAGPAGRALAHRACAAGLRVAVIDPAPDRRWTATYGMYADDFPEWLDPGVAASTSSTITVFTPDEHVVERGYAVLDTTRLQAALTLTASTIVAARATSVTTDLVTCADGTVIRARHVVDARGAVTGDHADRPRQTAAGAVVDSADTSVVLMDWRRVGDGEPSFGYRIPLGGGRRLIEETCLAGRPPIPVDELAARNVSRGAPDRVDERVDFPLRTGSRPWRRRGDEPLRFGAAGGLMNPATGYSVAQSLNAVDVVVDAIASGLDPTTALWTRRAKVAYRLRLIGLDALLGLTGDHLPTFFDAFFGLDVATARRYLSTRDDAVGVAAAMWSVFVRLPPRCKLAVAARSVGSIVGRS